MCCHIGRSFDTGNNIDIVVFFVLLRFRSINVARCAQLVAVCDGWTPSSVPLVRCACRKRGVWRLPLRLKFLSRVSASFGRASPTIGLFVPIGCGVGGYDWRTRESIGSRVGVNTAARGNAGGGRGGGCILMRSTLDSRSNMFWFVRVAPSSVRIR